VEGVGFSAMLGETLLLDVWSEKRNSGRVGEMECDTSIAAEIRA
jgi:hypothetical protein